MNPLLTTNEVMTQGTRLVALVLLAGVVALLASFVYRWYIHDELPQGVGILLGAAAIALVLNTTASLGESIGGTTDLLDSQAAMFTILAFVFGGFSSELGRYVGDRAGHRFAPGWALGGIDTEVVSFVKGGGRTVRVTLPETIEDIDGYDPVRSDIKEDLAGETMTFPGRLTYQELHDAFVARLQGELGIGKVDVEFSDTGEVLYLGVGRGEAGLGHALPPGQVATAIRADPAYSATPGDQVRIWQTDPEPQRLFTGEVRGIAGDIVTVAVEEEHVDRLRDEGGYRLVTLSRAIQADREFATILRRANDSVVETTVADGSSVIGKRPDEFEIKALVVRSQDGQQLAPPPRDRPFAVGDEVIAMGRPDRLRRFEATAQGTSP